MKLKVNDDGLAPLDEAGLPTVVYDDGHEAPLDFASLIKGRKDDADLSKSHKKLIEQMKPTIQLFEGIEDPESWMGKARKALETVANFDDKKLVDAGKVEQIKASMQETFEATKKDLQKVITEREESVKQLQSRLERLTRGRAFTDSKYIQEEIDIPPDLMEAKFGHHFRVESEGDQEVVRAYWDDGELILSRKRPGEPAEFDEALSLIVDKYPHKKTILKGTDASGMDASTTRRTRPGGKLETLQAAYAEAEKAGNANEMIRLTGEIFRLQSGAAA